MIRKMLVTSALCLLAAFSACAGTHEVTWAQDKATTKLSLNDEEFDLLCHTVFCEAGDQDSETQRLIAVTILNRVLHEGFPNTLHEVIYQGKGKQFNVVRWKGFPDAYEYTDTTVDACTKALSCSEEPLELLFFRNKHYHKGYRNYVKSGDVFFSLG